MPEPIVREHPQRAIRRLERQVEKMRQDALMRPLDRIDADAIAAINSVREVVAALASEIIALRVENEAWRGLVGANTQPPAVTNEPDPASGKAGILHGWKEIGEFIGIGEEAVRHRAAAESMPVARSGRRVWIRRATLIAWLAEQEAKAAEGDANG